MYNKSELGGIYSQRRWGSNKKGKTMPDYPKYAPLHKRVDNDHDHSQFGTIFIGPQTQKALMVVFSEFTHVVVHTPVSPPL